MSIAVVTGCAGFIASHLVEELLKNNWIVYGIDNFHPYYDKKLKEFNLKNLKKSKNFTFIEGSILSKSDLNKIPKNIDYLFFLFQFFQKYYFLYMSYFLIFLQCF